MKRGKILVVDDNQGIRSAMKILLSTTLVMVVGMLLNINVL